MNDFTIFIYFICFAAVAGATFAFMFKTMTATFEEFNKPPIKRPRHPEMEDVKNGDELLVFRSEDK
ncbi:hypothetical protein CYXG_00190 [Synechococcus phage S-SSM4]|jgi:hypothetical protein|uniref:Uncharacterized protein n=1 Tax=Synechococcus phage S-SSM4 TaxID=536466 RepID=M1TUZ3_9CAUD|nr:hypothetical protein CYXG_00190 [Synechococcus phage S-SSM4]AGG54254.1 hypothetical protein CYXG_00190 [Synechococcus phage S-SSM4]AGG54388.1 hypothetical protein CYWG_00104 [Cyanophage S-SSM6b]|tara:strand:+ start:695 stop:892 length:198 start_codon:yes stop_codon:yes gene_type:complete